jgi:ABC-type multidrug transport system ATPase subunit
LSSIFATLHPPTSGDILFKGISIYQNLPVYRNALGFCPQRQNLDMLLNVRENLIFAGRYYVMDIKEINHRVAELMEQLELTRYATFRIDQLSGGTKQRVLIARALMHSPEIVILDEPTVGLDPDIRRKLWAQILALKQQGITVILTTHYLDEAEVLSDRVCVLNRGKVLLIETASHLKEKHKKVNLEEVFLHLMQETHGA